MKKFKESRTSPRQIYRTVNGLKKESFKFAVDGNDPVCDQFHIFKRGDFDAYMASLDHPLDESCKNRKTRLHLTEADKSRFINPIWDELEEDPGLVMHCIHQDSTKFPERGLLITWLNSGAADKYKIDWQKFDPKRKDWEIDDVAKDIIQPYLDYQTDKNLKKDPKTNFSSKEDFLILKETKDFLYVGVLSWQGAVFCDSFKCGGAGAKWCIGYKDSDSYWYKYIQDKGKRFVLVYNKNTFGSEYDQKFMLEIGNSDYYDQRVTCRGWLQSDNPDETYDTEYCCEAFNLNTDLLAEWYTTLKARVTSNKVDTFSMRAVMSGEKVFLSDVNQSVYLEDFNCTAFDYVKMLQNVHFGNSIRELVSKGNGDILQFGTVIMGPSSEDGKQFYIDSRKKPSIVFQNYKSIFIADLWVTTYSPGLTFLNCEKVVIGTIHLPASFDPENETCVDPEALLKDFKQNWADNNNVLCFQSSSLTVLNGVKYFPREKYLTQNPVWLAAGDKPTPIITDFQLKHANAESLEDLTGSRAAYVDFGGKEKYFTDKTFDLAAIVTGVPSKGSILCINVPIGCSVIYSEYPEAKIRLKYTKLNNLSEHKIVNFKGLKESKDTLKYYNRNPKRIKKGKMKGSKMLKESENSQFKEDDWACWIRNGKVLDIDDGVHSNLFFECPEWLGLTDSFMKGICNEFNLTDFSELQFNDEFDAEDHPAWEKLMRTALLKGAVRVRHIRGETYVTYGYIKDLTNAILDFPEAFIGKIHTMHFDDPETLNFKNVKDVLKNLKECKNKKALAESENSQFNVLYHGSHNGELRKTENHKYNCLYVTPVFAYAAMYSTDSDSTHGCVFEMRPVRDLNIFDANDEGALDQLKAKVEELNPENTLVKSIKWEDLKTKDWSTVCFRKDTIRDDLLLRAVKALGYDGYINTEWDESCAEFYAKGLGGCGKIVNTTSIGIFDENLLEIVDEKYFEDYSDDELFNECHQADEDLFITFLQDEGFDDYYYDNEEDAKKWAADNLLFLDVDEVNDLVDEYVSCYDD